MLQFSASFDVLMLTAWFISDRFYARYGKRLSQEQERTKTSYTKLQMAAWYLNMKLPSCTLPIPLQVGQTTGKCSYVKDSVSVSLLNLRSGIALTSDAKLTETTFLVLVETEPSSSSMSAQWLSMPLSIGKQRVPFSKIYAMKRFQTANNDVTWVDSLSIYRQT